MSYHDIRPGKTSQLSKVVLVWLVDIRQHLFVLSFFSDNIKKLLQVNINKCNVRCVLFLTRSDKLKINMIYLNFSVVSSISREMKENKAFNFSFDCPTNRNIYTECCTCLHVSLDLALWTTGNCSMTVLFQNISDGQDVNKNNAYIFNSHNYSGYDSFLQKHFFATIKKQHLWWS